MSGLRSSRGASYRLLGLVADRVLVPPEEDGVTPDQWVAIAVAQKIGAVEATADFFHRRAGRARPGDLRAILALVPDRPADEGDEMLPDR